MLGRARLYQEEITGPLYSSVSSHHAKSDQGCELPGQSLLSGVMQSVVRLYGIVHYTCPSGGMWSTVLFVIGFVGDFAV